MVLLDAVIPVRNNVRYTSMILHHIAACDVKPRKLYLIDNDSDDETPRVCKEYQQRLPFMEYIRRETKTGVNAAWNYAFENSDAGHIFVLNNDLILNHQFFKKTIDTIEQYPNYGILQAFDVSSPELAHQETHGVHASPVGIKMVGYAFCVSRRLLDVASLIPESLEVYCGDQLLFDIAIEEKMPVLLMEHNLIYHYKTRTCNAFKTLPEFFPRELKEFQRLTKERCAKKGVPLPWNATGWR